ncbi:MAG: putative DNA-binding domain-containing protein, partial [Myxococcales bacterium]|nr:putative DNA-binding domain-containing protein [Myxococcales bacterium]
LGEAVEAAPVAGGAGDLSEQTALDAAQAALWGALRSEGGSAAIRARAPALDQALAQHIADTAALSRGARLDIYILSGSWRLREALAHAYPTLAWLLGDARFDRLAARVLRDAPSRDPDLGRFGGALPRLLAATELAAGDPWLVEVAALERSMTELLDAADPPPTLDRAALAAWSPERWPTLRLRPIPALRILDAALDVGALWSLREAGEDPEAAWRSARQGLDSAAARLIWRRDFQVFHRPLAAAEAATLRALVAGEPLASALDAALTEAPDLAPTTIVTWLSRWLDDRLFAA